MSYNSLQAIVDPNSKKIMYIEDYGPKNGFFIEGWRALHFPLTSSIVEKSYREGGITIYIVREGKAKLNLIPSFSPIGIESCKIMKNEVEITIAGIGGGGVSASFSRGMADGVKQIEVISEGGGEKYGKAKILLPKKRLLLIGVDDTDNDIEGATYSLVHNITKTTADKYKVVYAIHVNVQLYPYNPTKTKNCFATVVGLIFTSDNQKKLIISNFKKELKEKTFSKNTAMAIHEGFVFSKEFTETCLKTKFEMIKDIDQLIKVAKKNKVDTFEITGRRGLIGAISSLIFFDKPDFAAKLPNQIKKNIPKLDKISVK